MRRLFLAAAFVGVTGSVVTSGCAKHNDYNPPPSNHVDAAIDTFVGECGTTHKVDCVVTMTCGANVNPLPTITICDDSNDGPTLEGKARTAAASMYPCTSGATFVATCTTSPTAFTCSTGFELEDATRCIPGMDYTADTSAICNHLPANMGACSVACDRTALYAFATAGYDVETCLTTDGVVFVVIAAPMTGNGKR